MSDPTGNPSGAPLLLPEQEFKKNVKTEPPPLDFCAWLRRELNKIERQDQVEEVRRTQMWVRNHRFYRGQQLGFISDLDGKWHDLDDTSGLYINNQFSFFVDSLAKEWEQSSTEFKVTPETSDQEKAGAARFARSLVEEYQKRHLTASFRQREGKFALLSGTYFRYTFYSTDVEGAPYERVPITEERETLLPGMYSCACGQTGSDQDVVLTGACPNCGAQPQIMPGQTIKASVVTGYQKIRMGDICTECVDPIEVKVHLHARTIRQSPYLRRKRLVLKQILENRYPYAQIDAKGTASSQTLIYQRALEQTSGNTFYSNRPAAGAIEPDEDLCEFEQYWLDPCYYKNYSLPEDLKLASGDTLPAGTRLIDVFPDGLYVAKVSDQILDIRNENKNKHWSGGVYHLEPSKFYGKGLEDLVDLQEQINEVHSLMFDHLMRNSAPPMLVDPLMVNPEDFTGKPGGIVPLRLGVADRGIQSAVFQLPSVSLSNEIFKALESYKEDMQSISGAFSQLAGAPDIKNDTATGIAIMREQAVSMLAPALALKAEVDTEWAYQILEHAQERCMGERYLPIVGRFGAAGPQPGQPRLGSQVEGRWFDAADVRGDFRIEPQPNSWMPRTELEQRNDIISFLTAGRLPFGFMNPQLRELAPELCERAAELFRIPTDADAAHADLRVAQLRLDKMKAGVQFYISRGSGTGEPQPRSAAGDPSPFAQAPGGPRLAGGAYSEPAPHQGSPDGSPANVTTPTPQMAQAITELAPIMPTVDNHEVMITFYRDYLKSAQDAEGIDSEPLLQAAVLLRIEQHKMALVGQMQERSAAAVIAKAPELAAREEVAPSVLRRDG